MMKTLIASLIIGFALLFFIAPDPANAYSSKSFSSRSFRPRNYKNGGSLYVQPGYTKRNGTYVQPHYKTRPDNSIYNNRKNRFGF